MLDLTGLVVALGSAIGIAAFAATDPILIYKSSTPQLVEYRGYSGKLVAKLLRERIREIGKGAGTTRGEHLSVFHADESAIERLAEEMHLDGVITALRDLLDLHRYSLELAIVNASDRLDFTLREGEGAAPLLSVGADELKMILKGESVDGKLFTLYAKGSNDIPALIDQIAKRFVERVDPYVLTRYYFVQEYPSGDFTKTLPMIKHSIEVLPPNEARWPLGLWARIHYRQGNYDAAIEKNREALALDPKFVFAMARWGETLVAQGQLDAGLQKMRDALQTLRDDDRLTKKSRLGAYEILYRLLGDTLAAHGRDEEAYHAYVEGLDLSPKNPLLETSLGELYLRHGQYQAAVRLLRNAILTHKDPNVPRKLLDQAFAELVRVDKTPTPL